MAYQKRLNFRIPVHLLASHWIRIETIVIFLVLQSTPTHVNGVDGYSEVAPQKIKYMYCTSYVLYFLLLVPTVRPLGSGAFGQVFLAQATGIVAFDPRGSTKRKSGRRRSRFRSTSRPCYNDKRVTAVAVKSLKGTLCNIYHDYRLLSTATNLKQHLTLQKNWMKFFCS